MWNGTFSLFRVLWFFCVLQFAGKRALAKLLGNLLLVQEKLLEQNPDTASVLIPGTDVKQSSAHGSNDDDDEEIPNCQCRKAVWQLFGICAYLKVLFTFVCVKF